MRVAGRVVALRPHGKAGFAHILGQGKRLQLYVKLDAVGPEAFELFRSLDLGDIIGVSGHLFRTKTNELTVWVEKIELLTKALLPLPEKFHGLADPDIRYRQRYLDLIANPDVREIFVKRARIMAELRDLLRQPRLHRSRNADDASNRRRRHGAAVRHASQHVSISISTCASRPSCI